MIEQIISALPSIYQQHSRSNSIYQLLDIISKKTINESNLTSENLAIIDLGNFGQLNFPYHKMGAVDTLDLFGLDELIIFSFYWQNRQRYKRAADIGANLGLHSILMSRCGWKVVAYEPDPVHTSILRENIELNKAENIELHEAAVSDKLGNLEFIRVLGNTTGSHLAGAKANPYGDLERFEVRVETINSIMPKVDFIKLDAEGQERTIILGADINNWSSTDMMLEIGSPENAAAIYNHLMPLGVNLFSQKSGWQKVSSINEVPTSYKQGSVFLSMKSQMPWGIEAAQ